MLELFTERKCIFSFPYRIARCHCDAICKFLECVCDAYLFRCPGLYIISFCIVDVGIFAYIRYFVRHFVCVEYLNETVADMNA